MAVDADEASSRGVSRKRGRQTKLFPKQLVSVSFDSDMSGAIEALEKGVLEKVLRSATYAGAFVFYTEMQYRTASMTVTGQLYESIYHYFDKKHSTKLRPIYIIGPNKAKAPHWYNVEYGHWRYNRFADGRWQRSKSNRNARVRNPGTQDTSVHDLPGALAVPVWVPAKPYIRPTYDGKVGYAIQKMLERAEERMRELLNELSVPA